MVLVDGTIFHGLLGRVACHTVLYFIVSCGILESLEAPHFSCRVRLQIYLSIHALEHDILPYVF